MPSHGARCIQLSCPCLGGCLYQKLSAVHLEMEIRELGDIVKGTQTQGFRYLFKANGKRKHVRRVAGHGGPGARLQGGMIDSGRGWDFCTHVPLESDMNLRGSTWETHVLELPLGRNLEGNCQEISNDIPHMWNLVGNDTNELTCRNRKTHNFENELMVSVCVGRWWCGGIGEEWLGLEGSLVHTTVFRVDNQWEPIV